MEFAGTLCAIDIFRQVIDKLIVSDSASLQKYRDYGTTVFTVSDELQAEIAKRSLDITMKYAAEEPGFKEIWENKKASVR